MRLASILVVVHLALINALPAKSPATTSNSQISERIDDAGAAGLPFRPSSANAEGPTEDKVSGVNELAKGELPAAKRLTQSVALATNRPAGGEVPEGSTRAAKKMRKKTDYNYSWRNFCFERD